MGRGRAKAKQAKVARQLKYSGAGTDLDALRRELLGGSPAADHADDAAVPDDLADEDDEDEDDEDDSADRSADGRG
jgi:hypothetical protein